jgi:hypothetical protein
MMSSRYFDVGEEALQAAQMSAMHVVRGDLHAVRALHRLRRRRVRKDGEAEAEVRRLARGGVHAHLRHEAAHDEPLHAALAQELLERRCSVNEPGRCTVGMDSARAHASALAMRVTAAGPPGNTTFPSGAKYSC